MSKEPEKKEAPGKTLGKKLPIGVLILLVIIAVAAVYFYSTTLPNKTTDDLNVPSGNNPPADEPENNSADTSTDETPATVDQNKTSEPESADTTPTEPSNTSGASGNANSGSTQTGTLSVHSFPSKAKVLVDGRDMGADSLTPVVLYDISAGYHNLSFERADLVPYSISVYVAPGKVTPVEVNLTLASAQFGTLNITTNPDQALVYLDGKMIGTSPLLYNATVEYHFLSVQKDGYFEYNKRIYANANKVINLYAELIAKS